MTANEPRKQSGGRTAAQIWIFAEAEFDESQWLLRLRGETLTIERRPLDILLYLLRHAGEAVTKDELIEAVWGHVSVSDGALTNAIGKLRRALDDDAQTIIETVHRIGYRLVPAVEYRPCAPRVSLPSSLMPGDPVPGRPVWELSRLVGSGVDAEVWLGAHTISGERRAFKMSPEGTRLPALKREAALLRLLDEALDSREDIVQLLDWNFDTLPFFIACEYGGEAMNEWADSQGGLAAVPLDLRVDLMVRVADAVAAAHSIGVLHKDLKPANVLIDGDANGCILRLTDFGSGQLTDPMQLAGLGLSHIGLTQARLLATDDHTGTHLYVAPELMTGNPPTVQSDIFSLGVMIYQIVVGDFRRPLAPGWEREVEDELLRKDIADAANGDPQHRIASARTLAERLRSLQARRTELLDLRASEALARENALALARAKSRRRWLLALVGVLGVGLLVSLYNYHLVAKARDEARRQSEIAAAINDFMNHDLLGSANPAAPGNKEITVHEAARIAASKADARLADRPEVASALHHTLGNLFSQMSDSLAAVTEYNKALSAYASMPAPDPVDRATVELLLASTQARLSHFDDAQTAIKVAETIMAQLPSVPTVLQQQLYASKAALSIYSLDCASAIRQLESAIALESRPDVDKKLLRSSRGDLANCYCGTGRNREADVIYQKLIADMAADEGWDAPRTLYLRVMSAQNQIFMGQASEAEAKLIEAHRQLMSAMGPDHRWTLWAESALAEVYSHQGKWQQAKDTQQTLYAHFQRLGTDNTVTGYYALAGIGEAEYQLGEDQDAIRDLQRAQDGLRNLSKVDSPLNQFCAYYLALTFLDEHRAAGAATLLAPLSADKLKDKDLRPDWSGRLALARGRAAAGTGQAIEARKQFDLAAADFAAHQPDDAALLDETRRQLAMLQ